MGWLIALGILVALSMLPIGLSLRYDADGFRMYALAGRIPIAWPGKQERPQKKTKKKKQAKKGGNQASSQSKAQKKGGSVADFLPLVESVLELLDAFRNKLRLRVLEMKLILAADDPCDLAINYGLAWSALGNLLPRLERFFIIQKRNLEVECDFEASEPVIIARLDLTITIGRLMRLLLRHGLRVIKEYLNLNKTKKGGAPK